MTLDERSLDLLLNNACRIAREAGAAIMAIYGEGFDVTEKADRTPLTEADMAAHRHIVQGLGELTPAIPILSEESNQIPFSERRQWSSYWLVDPLDGTREFIKRNGEFTVNIALIQDHEPVLGVVFCPALDLLYSAARGLGAHRRQPSTAAAEPIQVSRVQRIPVIAGSRSHGTERLQALLERVGEHELISMGSSLKFCLVADGRADFYPRLGPTCEWDTAAAHCIVREAGGQVTDVQFEPLRYNTKDSLLNPEFLVIGDTDRDWSRYLEGL
ncbi:MULTISPECIES: 3'(2'),5'-bisphosphate nucleotidase CysQ [unclassified Ectothiorhodospira]|uniref:3'(2'),5'-bisphosphate nucleotidase CysQ n=1 Tax=unclassified Ectothiorhodospira TaxID=2684909 RepID=UPI001EE84E42|nr:MULTISPECIES: 3'(2'),5'-bisphosphate nucleotidase CysQ [unclassified Ectothiorhodospira]MCG5514715.1 3'(2'),5'-bisphosphate nucleotidase CysQ [Ectothiorhodospira sp. 9100]MCG5518314.1 3'(2'),5'-bisphosphate nucleotidase CysQ [Ectothiorhodospira sp. 9905]